VGGETSAVILPIAGSLSSSPQLILSTDGLFGEGSTGCAFVYDENFSNTLAQL
jgi:hypothetical protein